MRGLQVQAMGFHPRISTQGLAMTMVLFSGFESSFVILAENIRQIEDLRRQMECHLSQNHLLRFVLNILPTKLASKPKHKVRAVSQFCEELQIILEQSSSVTRIGLF